MTSAVKRWSETYRHDSGLAGWHAVEGARACVVALPPMMARSASARAAGTMREGVGMPSTVRASPHPRAGVFPGVVVVVPRRSGDGRRQLEVEGACQGRS